MSREIVARFVPAIDEDLTSYRAVSEALSSAECSVEALPSIARTLAALHSKTRHPGDELKRDDRKRELAARVFATEPGARASNTDELSSAFKACDETVTHGNFSDDSVLVDGSGDVKVVDWSHSCTGPRSFDVGCFVASLFLLYYRHEAANERQAMYSLVDGCKHFVQTYVESLPQEWRPADGSQFYSDVAGYAGVWLAYR
ncbi:PREDICTED: methylthioribose kinase-like [Priapulus caudatus]|uniref:Methylthioribose kinase-like n=1 Tax=Priapulus caudatus TaxID=37621 RepID=A0ABM1ERH3_PRICU|nr:PREDICTED: methylthioribose kinase-like [Priapulus caudatus]